MPETASGKTLKAEEAAALKDRQKKRGIRVTSIQDVTPVPHNGVRPSKRRRV